MVLGVQLDAINVRRGQLLGGAFGIEVLAALRRPGRGDVERVHLAEGIAEPACARPLGDRCVTHEPPPVSDPK
jgi:hypothetical protein